MVFHKAGRLLGMLTGFGRCGFGMFSGFAGISAGISAGIASGVLVCFGETGCIGSFFVHISQEVLLFHKLLGMGILSRQNFLVLVHHLSGKAFPNLFSLVEKHYPVAVLHYRA